MDLTNTNYVSERINPLPGEPFYLHLSDLLLGLRQDAATEERITVLDYGCGGSPYRPLFPNADYVRADLSDTAGIDCEIGADGSIAADPESFDLILSTQVLEHVGDVSRYLKNCFDLLRSGGKLVLTTHGTFEDHSCPYDYYRWTTDGIRRDVTLAGFEVLSVKKLTTGGRALALLMRTKLHLLAGRRRGSFGLFFSGVSHVLTRLAGVIDIWCDLELAGSRVVDASEAGHTIYIAVLVIGRKSL